MHTYIYRYGNVTYGSSFIHSSIKIFLKNDDFCIVLESGKLRSIENNPCFQEASNLGKDSDIKEVKYCEVLQDKE